MKRLAAAVVLAGLLTAGCEDRECVRGHHQPVLVNKVTTLMWVCDEYAPVGAP